MPRRIFVVWLAALGCSSDGSGEADAAQGSATSGGSGTATTADAGSGTAGAPDVGGGASSFERRCASYVSDFGEGIAEQSFEGRVAMELVFVRPVLHLWESLGPSNYLRQVATPSYYADGAVSVSCRPRENLPAMAGEPYVTFFDALAPGFEMAEEACSKTFYRRGDPDVTVAVAEHLFPGKSMAELAQVRVIARRTEARVSRSDVEYVLESPRPVYVREGAIATECGDPALGPTYDAVYFLVPEMTGPPDVAEMVPCVEGYAEREYPGRSLEEVAAVRVVGHWDDTLISAEPDGLEPYRSTFLPYPLVQDDRAAAICITEHGAGAPTAVTMVLAP